MNYITIPKVEYQQLKRQAKAFRLLSTQVFKATLQDPISEVVQDFKKTNLYSSGLIKDLEAGLRKSSYAKRV